MTIFDYVTKLRIFFNDLEVVDYVIDDDDCESVCLEGLPQNYDVFKTSLHVLGILSFD